MEAKQGEVVVSIPRDDGGDVANARSTPAAGDLDHRFHPSPEISSKAASPSPRKPPRPPGGDLLCRRSISNSILKPNSRFAEQPTLVTAPAAATAASPRRSSAQSSDGEEDDFYWRKADESASGRGSKRRCCGWREAKLLLEVTALSSVLGLLAVSLASERLRRMQLWCLEPWKWCTLVLVVFFGHLISRWLVTLLVFVVERNFLLRRKALYFAYGLRKSVRVCVWLGLVLLAWSMLVDPATSQPEEVTRVLKMISMFIASMLIGSAIWVVKTFLMKLLASSFHMKTFFDRIQESLFNQYVLFVLSHHPERQGKDVHARLSVIKVGLGEGKVLKADEKIDIETLRKMRREKSAWTMNGLMQTISTTGLSTLSGLLEIYGDDEAAFQDQEINSEQEARVVALKIFKYVAKPGHKHIDREDLLKFFKEEDVDSILPLFEGAAESGKIKRSALRNWVVKAYNDRKSLAHSLNDAKTAVKQLHMIVRVLVVILIVVITLLMMGIATTKVIFLISSQLLLVAFMFGNACKTVFEAIIFVFIMHPFDVGDRCLVDGVQMVVEEMNILTTVFLKADNEKIYYPNSVLSTKPISNYYRSPNMKDTVDIAISFSTPAEKIAALKSQIKSYLESKPNHWSPTHSVVVKDIVNLDKMSLSLIAEHTMNFQNIRERNSRRSELVLELKKILEQLSINYQMLPQKVHLSCDSGLNPFVTLDH